MKQLTIATVIAIATFQVAYGQNEANRTVGERPVPVAIKANAEARAELRADAQQQRSVIQEERKEFQEANVKAKAEFRAEANAKKVELQAEFQAASSTEERQAVREKAQAEKEALIAERKNFVDKRKAQAKNFIAERTVLVVRRLNEGISRGDQILSRLETAAESSTADVEQHFTAYAVARAEAVSSLARAEAQIELVVSTETAEEARVALGEAKTAFKATAEAIKDMYGSLRAAFGEIKSARVEAEVESESSVEVTS